MSDKVRINIAEQRILVQELVISARIGHTAEERRVLQPIAFDLTLTVDWSKAATSLNLNDTVCYATLCQELRNLVEKREWVLLEELSAAAQQLILSRFPAVSASSLRIKKFALPGTDWVAVDSLCTRHMSENG